MQYNYQNKLIIFLIIVRKTTIFVFSQKSKNAETSIESGLYGFKTNVKNQKNICFRLKKQSLRRIHCLNIQHFNIFL